MNQSEAMVAASEFLNGAPPLCCRLLILLHPGRITAHRYLMDELWPEGAPYRTDLATVVTRLRKFLPPGFTIRAVYKIGYRLEAPAGWSLEKWQATVNIANE